MLAPRVIQQLLLLSTILSIFFLISNAANYKNYRTRKKRWRHHKKKARRFRHRRLPYHLVQRCRTRQGNRPLKLNSTSFRSSSDNRNRHWKKRNQRSRARAKRKRANRIINSIKPQPNEGRFHLPVQISNTTLTKFCSSSDFLSPTKLMREFQAPERIDSAQMTID